MADDKNEPSSEPGASPIEDGSPWASHIILPYLRDRVPEFRELEKIRRQGWENPEGDRFFARQRRNADTANDKTAKYFYGLMQHIGDEIQNTTGAFSIPTDNGHGPPRILDTCMAPGGLLQTALKCNPTANALGFSLPVESGGHKILLPQSSRVETRLLDVTMLAADMNAASIPETHPDMERFLPLQLTPDDVFDLVICDGQVLRTHTRADYRQKCEARRLITSQLALGVGHVRPGGSMMVLLHKPESWNTLLLLYRFSKFATIKLHKPTNSHQKRSSFYMIAKDIQSDGAEAIQTVELWKEDWRRATFNVDEDSEKTFNKEEPSVEEVLDAFGLDFIRLGRKVWATQAKALAKAPFNNPKHRR